MCRRSELIYSIVIALSLTLVFGMRPWVVKVHNTCIITGVPAKDFRKGWRARCETNIKPGEKYNASRAVYRISGLTNAKTTARANIWFGPNYPNGHPSAIHYDSTMNPAAAMSVMFAWNESIFLEASDFGTEYCIQIRTPDVHSASCYKLVNDRSRNITLTRAPSC